MLTEHNIDTQGSPIPMGNPMTPPGFWRRRAIMGAVVHGVLFSSALISIVITLGIVYVLLSESIEFFYHISLFDFITDTQWTPMFEDAHFGILPLLSGTFLSATLALLLALPLGMLLAIYLSEYANSRVREIIKPCLELLEGVPTVIYGYFALLFLTPLFQIFLPDLARFNLLVPSLVIGIMILPYVVSMSEDAMRSVPSSLREGAYALGFNRFQTAVRVVIPAAFSGITAAYILGMSRAVGETMVVAIAAGQNARIAVNPLEGAATITSYIVQVSLGDLPHGTIAYQTIFAAGLTLFFITLLFNLVGFFLRKRFTETY